jgi:hypothetical protein
MLTLYNFLLYWSLFGYAGFILLYLLDKRFNFKTVNGIKYVRLHIKPWHMIVIVLLCGPAVTLTATVILIIDILQGNWIE